MHSSSLALFFHRPPTTEIYTLSLHDALPISITQLVPPSLVLIVLADQLGKSVGDMYLGAWGPSVFQIMLFAGYTFVLGLVDRKSTRLNSSHANISYAVFCLKKKNKKKHRI